MKYGERIRALLGLGLLALCSASVRAEMVAERLQDSRGAAVRSKPDRSLREISCS